MTTDTNTSAEKNVLEKIVDNKRIEIDALKVSKPLATVSYTHLTLPTKRIV